MVDESIVECKDGTRGWALPTAGCKPSPAKIIHFFAHAPPAAAMRTAPAGPTWGSLRVILMRPNWPLTAKFCFSRPTAPVPQKNTRKFAGNHKKTQNPSSRRGGSLQRHWELGLSKPGLWHRHGGQHNPGLDSSNSQYFRRNRPRRGAYKKMCYLNWGAY